MSERSCVYCFHASAVGGYKPECMFSSEAVDLIETYGSQWEDHSCDNWEHYDEEIGEDD